MATLVNHAFAGVVGDWVAKALGPDILRWVIGVSFIAMAGWMLIPDKVDDDAAGGKQRFGVFGTTVVAGTTIGMMLANVPAVFLGDTIAKKESKKLVHGIAATIFAVLGLLTRSNVGNLC